MRITLLLLLLSGCGCSNERLAPTNDCGRPCGVAPNRGACHQGEWYCDADGGMTCMGEVGPSAEICDGIDNDCDGVADDKADVACSTACGKGKQFCLNGQLGPCNAPQPHPEICNGLDDDCDGVVDNPEDMPVAFCYTGPADTVNNGICHPGTSRCVDGRMECVNEQVPIPETCNGIDDNCNGAIDEGLNGPPLDLVIVIDDSGSMTTSITELTTAVRTWVTKYSSITSRRYALVTAPDNDYQAWLSNPRLYKDFTDAAGLANAVSAQYGATGSGLEPTLDALDDLLSVNNPLHLSWRRNSRHAIIVFSDEEPQSAWTPEVTLSQMVTEVSGDGVVVNVFTNRTAPGASSPLSVATQWDMIAGASGGTVPGWNIHGTSSQIEANLDQIIHQVGCQ